jgi:hypothetical protein
LAQQALPQDGTPAASSSSATSNRSKVAMSLEERLPGDHWTIEVWDEITWTVSTQTKLVTKVTPTDISERFNVVRPDRTFSEGPDIVDRSWNSIRGGPWQYFAYDGNTGGQTPLTGGKTGAFQFNTVNSAYGVSWKWSGTPKIVDQQTVTTKAGTFETFRIETTSSKRQLQRPNPDRGIDSSNMVACCDR